MPSFSPSLAWLGLAWGAYFALHSLLASLTLKHWIARHRPGLVPAYRLAFNALAVALVLPLLWATLSWDGPWLWRWQGVPGALADGLALAAIAAFVWTLRGYDGGEFLGLRQLRTRQATVEDQETLHISTFHRYVRHPWYFLGLVILWTRDMNPAILTTAVVVTLYLVIGSRLEERKLVTYHGDAYRDYRRHVPGLIPLPWKRLRRDQAERLGGDQRR